MNKPTWLTEGIIYEIFPRAYGIPQAFRRVTDRLPAIAELGATVIWLMPIHPIGRLHRKGEHGSPYAVADYRGIHPDYGAEADLTDFVKAAHRLGLRVIIDWVANHCAWDSNLMAHPDWFQRDPSGSIRPGGFGWHDVAKLDHGNPALRNYLVESMCYWVEEFDVDGFRCDVADFVPLTYWHEARAALTEIKPDIGLLAEAYHPALMQEAFDLAYDIPAYLAVRQMITLGRPARLYWGGHQRFIRQFPERARRLRYIDNHDQPRAASLYGREAALAAAALLLTGEGAPLLYNGQEIGDETPTAGDDLFAAHKIDWNREKAEYLDWYKQLISLRKTTPALRSGRTIPLGEPAEPVVAFAREHEDRYAWVAVNLSAQEQEVAIYHDRLPAGITPALARGVLDSQAVAGEWRLRLAPYGASMSLE